MFRHHSYHIGYDWGRIPWFFEERVDESSDSFAVTRSSSVQVGMGEETGQDVSILLRILRSVQLARNVVEDLDLVTE